MHIRFQKFPLSPKTLYDSTEVDAMVLVPECHQEKLLLEEVLRSARSFGVACSNSVHGVGYGFEVKITPTKKKTLSLIKNSPDRTRYPQL